MITRDRKRPRVSSLAFALLAIVSLAGCKPKLHYVAAVMTDDGTGCKRTFASSPKVRPKNGHFILWAVMNNCGKEIPKAMLAFENNDDPLADSCVHATGKIANSDYGLIACVVDGTVDKTYKYDVATPTAFGHASEATTTIGATTTQPTATQGATTQGTTTRPTSMRPQLEIEVRP